MNKPTDKELKQSLTATKNEFHTIEDGKKATIRKGYRNITLGDLTITMLNGDKTITVNVTQVIHCKIIDLPHEYVKKDDFLNKHDLINQLKQFYPDINEITEITAIVFEHKQ